LEESLVVYARLKQRQEFMYTFRMIVYLSVYTNDFNRLAHLLIDYRQDIGNNLDEKFNETVF